MERWALCRQVQRGLFPSEKQQILSCSTEEASETALPYLGSPYPAPPTLQFWLLLAGQSLPWYNDEATVSIFLKAEMCTRFVISQKGCHLPLSLHTRRNKENITPLDLT